MYTVSNPKGATVTVFAPYDCKNNCPFCVNKKEYKENPQFNVEKVKESMSIMSTITPECDFVITGGEPLADLVLFDEIVNHVRVLNGTGAHHKLFVNTTLPVKSEDIPQLNSYIDVITGFNISRHIGKYTHENGRELIDQLKVPVRINCVLYTEYDATKVLPFIEAYNGYSIQFRDNYIGVNEDNVFWASAVYLTFLQNIEPLVGSKVLIHKESFRWNAKITDNIHFHRTTCYSKLGNEINDIIINPRGDILDDWNEFGSPLDTDEYSKAIEN